MTLSGNVDARVLLRMVGSAGLLVMLGWSCFVPACELRRRCIRKKMEMMMRSVVIMADAKTS